MTPLEKLEQDLSKSKDYDGRKNDAAKHVREHFIAQKGETLKETEIDQHYLKKKYSRLNFNLENLTDYSFCELELSFYELIEKALFSVYKKKEKEAKVFFNQAQKTAKVLANSVTDNYLKFSKSLSGANVAKKLKIDMCYDLAYDAVSVSKKQAIEFIGVGFLLAKQIKDDKRVIDFLARSQYLLYHLSNFPHSALSLGAYIIAKQPKYETRKLWTHFHNGNIHLDLEDVQSAKKEYEWAIDFAFKTKSDYALMTLHERLGLTFGKENNQNLANFHYENSDTISQAECIESVATMQNKVRCLMGQGMLEHHAGQSHSGTAQKKYYQLAETIFKQAADLAKQIGYPDNEATAFSNLGNLYRTWHGENNVEAKTFHKVAYEIQKKIGLDESLKRVKWNIDHM